MNELFAYSVVKQTKVKDARLGLLQYGFMFLIFIYIAVYQIFYKNGFLLLLAPSGTVILDAQHPALPSLWNPETSEWDTCCPTKECAAMYAHEHYPPKYSTACKSTNPPCDLTSTKCYTDFTPLQNLPYCIQSGNTSRETDDGKTSANYPCVFWDGTEASIGGAKSMFVTSTASVLHQIAHISPATAQSSSGIIDGTFGRNITSQGYALPGPYLSPGLIELSTNNSPLVQEALCKAACAVNSECIAWTLIRSKTGGVSCGLKGQDATKASLFPLPKSQDGAISGFQKGTSPAPAPACGCPDSTDPWSCFVSTDVDMSDGKGPVPGYDPSNKNADYSCHAMYHTSTPLALRKQFVADVERFTVTINHNVEQSDMGYSVAAQDMYGWLEVGDHGKRADTLCRENPTSREMYTSGSIFGYNGTGSSVDSAPCLIQPVRSQDGLDFFTVGDLMTAAGADFDTISQSSMHSVRYRGIKLIMAIQYSNYKPFTGVSGGDANNEAGVTFIYKVTALNSETLQQSVQWANYPSERLLSQLNGVLITAVQTGRLAKFDFATLMLTVTTSITFLTVASMLVKYIAQYLCTNKKFYKEMMIEESVDMSRLVKAQDLHEKSRSDLSHMCAERHLPASGNKEELILRLLEDREDDVAATPRSLLPPTENTTGDRAGKWRSDVESYGGPQDLSASLLPRDQVKNDDNLAERLASIEAVLQAKGLLQ